MSESLTRSEALTGGREELEFVALSREDFLARQNEALNRLMDGLEMDYRDDIVATHLINYKGINTYMAELASPDLSVRSSFSREMMLLDEGSDGEMLGYGFITFFNNGIARVGDTFTNNEYRRQGLGRRRLELMNGITSQLYGQVLHSGLSIEPEAESIWQTLVDEGVAEPYQVSPEITRWRFKDTT